MQGKPFLQRGIKLIFIRLISVIPWFFHSRSCPDLAAVFLCELRRWSGSHIHFSGERHLLNLGVLVFLTY